MKRYNYPTCNWCFRKGCQCIGCYYDYSGQKNHMGKDGCLEPQRPQIKFAIEWKSSTIVGALHNRSLGRK